MLQTHAANPLYLATQDRVGEEVGRILSGMQRLLMF